MAYLTDSVRLDAVEHAFKVITWTAPAAAYVALSTTEPTSAGANVTEPVGNGYTRKLHSSWVVSGSNVINNGAITFPTATGAWGTLTHYAIYSASVGGTCFAYGALTTSKSPTAMDTVRFAHGEITVSR